MKRGGNLVELHLSGKSASCIIDALLDELPSQAEIRREILADLPPGSKIRFEDERTCFVSCPDRHLLAETTTYYERVYPEIEFVVETKPRPIPQESKKQQGITPIGGSK